MAGDTFLAELTGFVCCAEPFLDVGAARPPGVSTAVEEEELRSFTPTNTPFSRVRFRFLEATCHVSSSTPAIGTASSCSARVAFSSSSCCFRKSSNCSVVSLRTAASCALVDSRTASKKSTSSSSNDRNWFLSFAAFVTVSSCVTARTTQHHSLPQMPPASQLFIAKNLPC